MKNDVNQCMLDDAGKIFLYVIDTGKVVFRTPENTYDLVCNDIVMVDYVASLLVNTYSNSTSNFTFNIDKNKIQEVEQYFKQWDRKALNKVKKAKFQSFLDFWNFTIDFVRDHVDIETLKPTYEFFHTDYTEYDGDLSVHFEISMNGRLLDDNGELDYDTCFALNDKWMDDYLDKFFDTKDYGLFGKIFVAFKP